MHFLMNCLRAVAWLALFSVLAVYEGCAAPSVNGRPENSGIQSFSVYILSRGQGVPAVSKEKLRQIESIIRAEGNRGDVVVSKTRIGLEGETRMCIEFADPIVGDHYLKRAQEIVKNVELMNVVVEPCAQTH